MGRTLRYGPWEAVASPGLVPTRQNICRPPLPVASPVMVTSLDQLPTDPVQDAHEDGPATFGSMP
jgi:hypothetical protein